jgi:phytanoyl-CoA hydroxylase
MLDTHQIDAYARDGYLVLPGFSSAVELAEVRERAQAIVEAFEPGEQAGVFSTREPARLADAALIASADQVHCFFEEEAFDAEGRLQVPKSLAINKIGHALHDLDPVFDRFSHGPALAALAADLGLAEPQVWQSQVIFKQPEIGGEVRWHQDASFFVTTPLSVTTFWFALEDAALDNGCLWVEPGGHRGPLREVFVRKGDQLRLEPRDPTPWPAGSARAVPLPVPAGTLVVFHGLLPHYSASNRSARSRMAYTLHVTDGRCAYSPANWLQRSGVRGLAGAPALPGGD